MPERPEPDLDTVRAALRRRDDTAEPPPTPQMSHGPSELRDDLEVMSIERDGEARFQLLRRELGVSTFGLNLLRLRSRQQGRIHRHERQEEVYLVLEGALTLEVEGEPRELVHGDLARVGPGLRRRLSNRGSELALVLAIGGAEPHEGRDGVAFASWDDHEGGSPKDIPIPEDLEA